MASSFRADGGERGGRERERKGNEREERQRIGGRRRESAERLVLWHCGTVGSDRVVAPPSPRPRLRGVWATVCHYPNARRNITHSKTGMLGAEMSEQEGGFQTRPVEEDVQLQ